MQVSADNLAAFLNTLPGRRRYLVAYSGGLDSHVLLHLLNSLKPDSAKGDSARADFNCRLRAVHVNHNLQPQSRDWVRHCRETCRALNVALEVVDIDLGESGGKNLESRARDKRYAAITDLLTPDETLLTAHHRDDQAETFLLRLLRGAGALGLASMRPVRQFGAGWHARPLLAYSRAQLQTYAEQHGLNWVEDPSNRDTAPDRNFLRHEALPVIRNRWPSMASTVSRAAQSCAEAQELLDDLARQDVLNCAAAQPGALDLEPLLQLSLPRQKNLLRYWCRSLQLPTPDSRQLAHVITDVLAAGPDSRARVGWKGAELRRHGNHLYLGAPLGDFDSSAIHAWDFSSPCRLECGELTAVAGAGNGLSQARSAGARVEVRYRRGGEKIRLPGRDGRHKLKKLFQEVGAPPWLRERIPLIYVNDKLALVVGYWTDADFAAAAGEPSWIISWNRNAPG